MRKVSKQLSKAEQSKIVHKINTAQLNKSMGYPRNMSGVTLNLKTGKYELR